MWKGDGTRIKGREENAQVFKEHFKNLYEHVLELLQQEPVINGADHSPTEE